MKLTENQRNPEERSCKAGERPKKERSGGGDSEKAYPHGEGKNQTEYRKCGDRAGERPVSRGRDPEERTDRARGYREE